jgi:hypothetical protein
MHHAELFERKLPATGTSGSDGPTSQPTRADLETERHIRALLRLRGRQRCSLWR